MIDDELMNKFDRIEDLPISEEMLGAYLEGKLDMYDMDNINMLVHNNTIMQSIVEDIANIDFEISSNFESIVLHDEVINNGRDSSFDTNDIEFGKYNEPIDHFIDVDIDHTYDEQDINNFLDDSSFELPEIPFF